MAYELLTVSTYINIDRNEQEIKIQEGTSGNVC